MSSKIFLICTGLLIVCNLFAGRYYPQVKDFICGCEYCETVHVGQPLDIGYHMMHCHSWRESTLKTMKIMELMIFQRDLARRTQLWSSRALRKRELFK